MAAVGQQALLSSTVSAGITPGNITLTNSDTFIVPPHNTITFEFFGGGAGGRGDDSGADGGDGTDTSATIDGVLRIARGGNGVSTSRVGGTASGGDTNTTGQTGSPIASGIGAKGGDAPSPGGAGGAQRNTSGQGNDGQIPGGGGGGALGSGNGGNGGGGGGRMVKTFAAGVLTPGASISITVGTGGARGTGNNLGGLGARGEARISWD